MVCGPRSAARRCDPGECRWPPPDPFRRHAESLPFRAGRSLHGGRIRDIPARRYPPSPVSQRMQMHTGKPPIRRVMIIYGTRPDAIKLAPVIRAMRASPLLSPIVTPTRQRTTIVDQVTTMFGVRPDHDLNIIRPRQTLHGLTARGLHQPTLTLQQERPHTVNVQADTTSAFARTPPSSY